MTLKMMGKKEGMTQLYNKQGNLVVCTVISVEPNVVSQIKTKEKDGYESLQLAGYKVAPSRVKNVAKPIKGHFAKSSIEPRGKLLESVVANVGEYQVGQELSVDHFQDVVFVDVTAVSKGKGHQGVMRRYGFKGGPASHGSGFHRHGGSTGMRSSPGRCLPGQKKSGHMGSERVTVQNLRVVKVDAENKLLLVEGAVPGATGCQVTVFKSKKK